MYLIAYVDIKGDKKKVICHSKDSLWMHESYCLEFDLPYHVYKLTKLY